MRAASVRDARRSYDRKVRMPADLAREEARLGSEGYQAWAKAREANDYESFKPVLAKIVQLRKDESAAVAPDQLPYDYQIDKFERGMKRERLVRRSRIHSIDAAQGYTFQRSSFCRTITHASRTDSTSNCLACLPAFHTRTVQWDSLFRRPKSSMSSRRASK